MYTELHCHSYFSLLDGASSPEDLVSVAKALGYSALALTDHNSLSGAVRFWMAAQQAKIHPIFGAEVTLECNSRLILLAETQQGYGHLCRLLTEAKRAEDNSQSVLQDGHFDTGESTTDNRVDEGSPKLSWEMLARYSRGLIALSGGRRGPVAAPLLAGQNEEAKAAAARLRTIFGREHFYIELQNHGLPDDKALCNQLIEIGWSLNLLLTATNGVYYAQPHNSRLRDALIAIRHNRPLQIVGHEGLLPWNSTYHLKEPEEMGRQFQFIPEAVARTAEIARRCQVSLDFSNQRLPRFPTPEGMSEFEYLYTLCHKNLSIRYPQLTAPIRKQLSHELDIIERVDLAGYLLIVWDLVRYAQSKGIRCQEHGSAAYSIVANLLTITAIAPAAHNLIFERFLGEGKCTMRDINIDFAAVHRDEVVQYVHKRYGHNHAAMVCNIVTYCARGALHDLGKALGLPLPVLDHLSHSLDTHIPSEAATWLESQVAEAEEMTKVEGRAGSSTHLLTHLANLMRQIDGCPHHLSIHSGGIVIAGPPIFSLVPLTPDTMPGRFVMQWDKDSVEDAGLIKIDLPELRPLELITESRECRGVQLHP